MIARSYLKFIIQLGFSSELQEPLSARVVSLSIVPCATLSLRKIAYCNFVPLLTQSIMQFGNMYLAGISQAWG